MANLNQLVREVSEARQQYMALITPISEEQSNWKSDLGSWNITEVTEHLFWAEHNGVCGMWKTLYEIRSGIRIRTFEFEHRGMSIEEVILKTWQPKEKVPEGAGPRDGGPIGFWIAAFNSLQTVLDAFAKDLKDDELRMMAHPHPISGPLDFHQRFEFLRYHINRHHNQVANIIASLPA